MSEAVADAVPGQKKDRLEALDVLRGLVMTVMALDHTRDYFHHAAFDLTNPDRTTAPMYFTRWVTHFCAPAFFLLAGIGASLAMTRGRSPGGLARYLVVRGAFLILVDLTLIRVGWDFNFRFDGGPWFIVLSTLGAGMILLAGLVYLPRWAVAAFGVVLIGGHNVFDGVKPDQFTWFGPFWAVLHVRGEWKLAGFPFEVTYPLVPWVGVMAVGFALGPVLKRERAERRWTLFLFGAVLTTCFLILRATNSYGDPNPWVPEPADEVKSLFSFLRTEKYPSSLQYLLMTLGPILMALAWLDRPPGSVGRRLMTLGRVPFFFYVAHLYLIHAAAVVLGWLAGFDPRAFCVEYTQLPKTWGFHLSGVYLAWALVLAVLYPVCAWFARLKQQGNRGWLSYL